VTSKEILEEEGRRHNKVEQENRMTPNHKKLSSLTLSHQEIIDETNSYRNALDFNLGILNILCSKDDGCIFKRFK
jgi:hypothetical protein